MFSAKLVALDLGPLLYLQAIIYFHSAFLFCSSLYSSSFDLYFPKYMAFRLTILLDFFFLNFIFYSVVSGRTVGLQRSCCG